MPPGVDLPEMNTSQPSHVNQAFTGDSPSHSTGYTRDDAGLRTPTAKLNNRDDIPAITARDLSPSDTSDSRVVYRVEYRDSRGRILDKKTANHPLETAPPPGDQIVLEVSTYVTILRENTSDRDVSSEDEAPRRKPKVADARYYSNSTMISSKTMTIHSEKLANALRAVVHYSPNSSLMSRTFSFDEPYRILFHHSTDLETYRYSHPS